MPDLTRATAKMEALMVDECVITWDPQGVEDDTFDYDSGQFTLPEGDATTLYDGACLWRLSDGAMGANAGTAEARVSGVLKIPLDADLIPEGAIVELTACENHPQQVGRRFLVVGLLGGTYRVAQALELRGMTTMPEEQPDSGVQP